MDTIPKEEITDQTPLAVQSWLSIGILYCNIFVFSGNELGKEFWKRRRMVRTKRLETDAATNCEMSTMIEYEIDPGLSANEFIASTRS